ncbi:hypothetical protein BpHYR1_011846 [Brachionus plicatilis]|uniref:Uncharacterized protein n=1 Tax=Brachionus plicatilis TaxID=10195 RepID=A0A3M7RDE8_BRAPC|nr:hypothetical protein BpHYR1_011846 [Brachionus plicatilis]
MNNLKIKILKQQRKDSVDKNTQSKKTIWEVVKVSFNHYQSQYYFLSTIIEINETLVIVLGQKCKRKTRLESLISISQPEQKNRRTLTNPYSSQANVLVSQHKCVFKKDETKYFAFNAVNSSQIN